MLHVYKTETVQADSKIIWRVRLIGAVGMLVGILLGGWRLVPISGAQCKASILHALHVSLRTAAKSVLCSCSFHVL